MIESDNVTTIALFSLIVSIGFLIYSRLSYARAPKLSVIEKRVYSPKMTLGKPWGGPNSRTILGNEARVYYWAGERHGRRFESLEIHLDGYRDWVKLEFDANELVLYETYDKILYKKNTVFTEPSTFAYAKYILDEVHKALVLGVWVRLEETEPLDVA